MKTIYKYTLQPTVHQRLKLPEGARILSVQNQRNQVVLWAVVDTEENIEEEYEVYLVGTGTFDIDCCGHFKYVSTVQLETLVLHVFVAKIQTL